MKQLILFSLVVLTACTRQTEATIELCNMPTVYEGNSAKVTITNGVWGNVSSMEGNCMPVINPSTCSHCAVKRTVRIYEYTLGSTATPYNNSTVFFTSLNTNLVREVQTDTEGF